MPAPIQNRLLSKVAIALRADRPLTSSDHPYTILSLAGQRHLYTFVCFRSRGCRFDYLGQCAMCEYWRSVAPEPEQMISAVANALARMETIPETLQITPSGSMFDSWEVPDAVREAIFSMVAQSSCSRYVCESRPEFVTPAAMAKMRAEIPGKELAVEIGLESATEFVLDLCLNKQPPSDRFLARLGMAAGSVPELFRRAVAAAQDQQVAVYANLLLGSPFLTPEEAIRDTVHSVTWALDAGAEKCILFPSHVKPYTVVHALWQLGEYQPPSLWSLVEVLWRLGPNTARDCFISWYRPQYTETHRRLGKRSDAWPTTCPHCESEVLRLLDAYRGGEDFSHVEWLHQLACGCKNEWRESLQRPPALPLVERILSGYAALARTHLAPEKAQALWPETEAFVRQAQLPAFAISAAGER